MNEVICKRVPAAETLYFTVRNKADRQIYNIATPGFEAYNDANYTNYDHSMTEEDAGNGFYYADFPAGLADGKYLVEVFVQAGGMPAEGDECVKEMHFSVLSGVVNDLETGGAGSVAAEVWAVEDLIDGLYTPAEILALIAAILLGKKSGSGTVTEIFRDLADTKDRVTATVTESGNRTAVVRDAT